MITSTSNSKVKWIRKLLRRKERQISGMCYVEGLRSIGEACQQGAQIHSLIVAPDLLSSEYAEKILQTQKNANVEIIEVSQDVFYSISIKDRPKGLAAIIYQRWLRLSQISMEPEDLWVALEAIQDPGNLGTILRTIDAVGGKGVILLEQSTDAYDPTSIRASTGAIFSQLLVRADYSEFVDWKIKNGYQVIGTSGTSNLDYQDAHYPSTLILLMGSERQGLSDKYLQICDELVSIPMVGTIDSLNLSVAAAVVLYEIFNRRRQIKI